MRGQLVETLVGLLVLVAAGFFVLYAMQTVGEGQNRNDYTLTAKFGSIGGVNAGSDVRMAGVKVGIISNISLDTKTFDAKVDMSIHAGIPVPEDSVARITTDGLLGSAYISIDPGAEEDLLEDGQEFDFTQGAVDLLSLLGQFAGGSSSESDQ
ncbi:MAG: outer membrane lipid asymmetry maintenance protein MlaD [Robiginitomaculum sp.]|nr:MAG: outer membrane lipid asymmetry maintenance protein MlaD [Robiginitomaculum sp.]